MDKDQFRKDNKGNDENGQSYLNDVDNDWEQFSNKLGKKITDIESEDTFFDEVNSSLAEQVSLEMGDNTMSTQVSKKKKKAPKVLKIFAIVLSAIMVFAGFLMFTKPGNKLLLNIAGNYIYGHLDYKQTDAKPASATDIDNTKEEVKKPVDDIVNILLLGVEQIGGAQNTDVMMIATLNTKEKTIKLTSLMRDLYVDIPGFNKNKLNSVYSRNGGDINLLYDTLQNNFGIRPDGYIMVNFNSFEQIVNILGGVEVSLTPGEARYLNKTNYISNPAYRTVVAGKQKFNGNQAVGYCRVRKVSTGTENNDFGRTQRSRTVLKAIFKKVKSKNVLQLGFIMNDILSKVDIKTDITNDEFNRYLEEAADLKAKELETLRLPSDNSFDNQRVPMGRYNVEVLVPKDWNALRAELKEFIYGTTANGSSTTDTTESSDSASSTTGN